MKPVYSSQKATQLIFVDSGNEENIDLKGDFCGQCKIDSESDFEPDEEDTENRNDKKISN